MIEGLYRKMAGFDVEPAGEDIINLILELKSKGENFAIYSVEDLNLMSINSKMNPLVGYGGLKTFPMISNHKVQYGGFGVFKGELFYSDSVTACLKNMRDQYRWMVCEYSYFTSLTEKDVVELFLERGYPVHYSPNMNDFARDYKIITDREMTKDEVYAKLNRV